MSNDHDYWAECIAIAAEECDEPITLTKEQLAYMAEAVSGAHEHYGMAFYSPPSSERLSDIEDEWRRKLKDLQAEFDKYKRNAETAVRQALRISSDRPVTIHEHGEVLAHGGRTTRAQ